MPGPDTTDWQQIRRAAEGDDGVRDQFARRYEAFVRARLQRSAARSLDADTVDDAVQEVFVECFKHGGVLATADPDRLGGFRAFLTGVVDNVARRFVERAATRRKHVRGELPDPHAQPALQPGPTPSQQLDRQWALAVLQSAAERMRARAARLGAQAIRRVDLLHLRFQDGLTIRAIAGRWGVEAAVLHHQYAKAREEFRETLLQALDNGRSLPAEVLQAECAHLFQLLGP